MKNAWDVLDQPSMTEKSIRLIETENKLTFIVDDRSEKGEIRDAVEEEFNVIVDKVNTLNDMKGNKKAFVKLSDKDSASEIATKLGII